MAEDRAFPLSALAEPTGTSVSLTPEGAYRLRLSEPVGTGEMLGYAITPCLFVATVSFACTFCPNLSYEGGAAQRWFSQGTWFSINLCLEGRCEVSVANEGSAVVAAGDLCVSCTQARPHGFSYPTGSYRGIEAFVCTDLARDPDFSLLRHERTPLERLAQTAGFASVFSGDAQLNGYLERLCAAVLPLDGARVRYEVLGLLLELGRRDLTTARPRFLLTRAQVAMARMAHDEIEDALDTPHDARELATRCGVSAATLNGYFASMYGSTIAGYLRRRRMEQAARLLREGAHVTEAASRVGYANPSKFARAFKHEHGMAPSEYRRLHGIG